MDIYDMDMDGIWMLIGMGCDRNGYGWDGTGWNGMGECITR
jgi:hypothetical protein